MIRALLIGCGNIGALYDLDDDGRVATYAKAFHRAADVDWVVFDADPVTAHRVAGRYGVPALARWDERPLGSYDLVVVSSPTPTHHCYLLPLIEAAPRLIICEKPVDVDIGRLDEMAARYRGSRARIMVNFHRRFQPRMAELARRIREIEREGPCSTVVVTYQRGFHNNASHAMDLLAFLFGRPFEPANVRVLRSVGDEFEADPTMALACQWGPALVNFVGLPGARFSHFDIELFFPRHAVSLRKGCDEVEIRSAPPPQSRFHPALQTEELWQGVLHEHMTHVLAHAREMLADPARPDNFLESVGISRTIIQLTQEPKS